MVTQLIYMSEPFGYDSATLAGILTTARRNNPRQAITGALICRHDIYLQMIEGDAEAIDTLFERIAADDRHLAVKLLDRTQAPDRLFPRWAMLHDPAHSWLWSPEEIGQGAVAKAAPETLQAIFARAASEASVG